MFPNRFEGFTVLEANRTARLMKGMVCNLHVLNKVFASIEHLVARNASVPVPAGSKNKAIDDPKTLAKIRYPKQLTMPRDSSKIISEKYLKRIPRKRPISPSRNSG